MLKKVSLALMVTAAAGVILVQGQQRPAGPFQMVDSGQAGGLLKLRCSTVQRTAPHFDVSQQSRGQGPIGWLTLFVEALHTRFCQRVFALEQIYCGHL